VKKILALILAVGCMMACSAGLADDMKMEKAGKTKKVTLAGTLVDVACYLDDHDTGNDHMDMKKCGTECLKGGSPAGLLVGTKLYTVVFPAPAFADFVGKQMELTGDLYGSTQLIPSKAVLVDKDGKKTDISLKGKAMM
jgi:hypothetical protein